MASLTPFSGTLGKRRAKHLLKRATYNITKARIDAFSNLTADQAMVQLLNIPPKKISQPVNYETGKPWIEDGLYKDGNFVGGTADATFSIGGLKEGTVSWWLHEAVNDTSISSKMTYFLSSFLCTNTGAGKAGRGLLYDYMRLLNHYALGDFKELIYQVTINNVMLLFLNNGSNTSKKPNENYAREVLELFTIGKGPQVGIGDYTNYTENDIVEAARLLTGWKAKWDRSEFHGGENGNIATGHPAAYAHDFGEKKFSNRFGNYIVQSWDTKDKTTEEKEARMKEELRLFFNMVLNQPETAKYICRRLYRYFVSRDITAEIENDIIVPLANTFRANYNFEITVSQLLKSQHFYDMDDSNSNDEIIGGLIKSPLDLTLQTLSLTHFPIPDPISDGTNHYKFFYGREIKETILVECSQNPFDPPSVAGFPPIYEAPGYDKFWFNSATIIPRYNIGGILLNSSKTKADFKITNFVETVVSDPKDATILITELTDLMFPESVSTDRINYFKNDILLDNGTLTENMWKKEWNDYKSSGDDSGVESALIPLFKALIWSQEYQVN